MGTKENPEKIILFDGSIYRGDIKFGKPHGKGTQEYLDGSVYEGEWVNGLKNGQGAYLMRFPSHWQSLNAF